MGVRDETLGLLRRGHSPGEIAKRMGVSLQTTLGYLDQMVGEGRVRRSDILLSIPARRRRNPQTEADRAVVRRYGHASSAFGDIYEDVRFIEVGLHRLIREALEGQLGTDEPEWWRQGVPESVRKTCQIRREEDGDPAPHPYCYTDIVDLRSIIDKQWSLLSDSLPQGVSVDKRRLLTDLLRLNQIRRMVMHPARGSLPTEEDFDFLRALRGRLFPPTLPVR